MKATPARCHKTLAEAQASVRPANPLGVEELVADKGYHSGEVLKTLHGQGVRSYLPEPQRKKSELGRQSGGTKADVRESQANQGGAQGSDCRRCEAN